MQTSERLQSARNRRRTLSIRLVTGLLLILVFFVAAYLLVHSNYFSVGNIIIEGSSYIEEEDIYRIAGVTAPINILKLNTADMQRRLLQDLRIESAEVTRKFPASVVITIKDRQPIAYAANQYGFAELDQNGMVLAVFKSIKHVQVPIITGVSLGSMYVGDQIENPVIRRALQFLSSLDTYSLGQLSEVNIRADAQLTAYTLQSVQIKIGGGERLTEKARWLQDILHELGEKKAAVEYVDLNYASPFIKFKKE